MGKSRKKLVSYTSRKPSQEQRLHYDLLQDIEKRLSADGINFDVAVSSKWERLTWAMGLSLITPLDVRNEGELVSAAHLARQLILGKTTLNAEFPVYLYGRSDWLRKQEKKAWPFIFNEKCRPINCGMMGHRP